MCPSGQSRSLQGFLGVEVGFGIEAKGRSGREVGKCGFVSVGGTDDLDAPIARGEETEGREYIMAGSWREGVRTDGGRESKKKTHSSREEGQEGQEEAGWGRVDVEGRRPASCGIYKLWTVWMPPKSTRPNRSSVGVSENHVTQPLRDALPTLGKASFGRRTVKPFTSVFTQSIPHMLSPLSYRCRCLSLDIEPLDGLRPWCSPTRSAPLFQSDIQAITTPPALTSLRVPGPMRSTMPHVFLGL